MQAKVRPPGGFVWGCPFEGVSSELCGGRVSLFYSSVWVAHRCISGYIKFVELIFGTEEFYFKVAWASEILVFFVCVGASLERAWYWRFISVFVSILNRDDSILWRWLIVEGEWVAGQYSSGVFWYIDA